MAVGDVTAATLECEVHGPMKARDDGRWECLGFDGEGCQNLRDGISIEAAGRLTEGRTYWPGVNAGGLPWRERRAELRERRKR